MLERVKQVIVILSVFFVCSSYATPSFNDTLKLDKSVADYCVAWVTVYQITFDDPNLTDKITPFHKVDGGSFIDEDRYGVTDLNLIRCLTLDSTAHPFLTLQRCLALNSLDPFSLHPLQLVAQSLEETVAYLCGSLINFYQTVTDFYEVTDFFDRSLNLRLCLTLCDKP